MTEKNIERRIDVIGSETSISHPETNIEGRVTKTDNWTDDLSTVRIFNADEAVISDLAQNDTLTVEAGYNDNRGIIIEGVVRRVNTSINESEKITEIILGTGVLDLQNQFISRTISGRIRPARIVRQIISQIDVIQIGNLDFPSDGFYPNRTISRDAFMELLQIAKDFDRSIFLQNLELFVVPPESTNGAEVFLNLYNGLQSVSRERRVAIEGDVYKAVATLTHQAEAGSRVTLEHPNADGQFRAVEVTHDLNTFETVLSLREES